MMLKILTATFALGLAATAHAQSERGEHEATQFVPVANDLWKQGKEHPCGGAGVHGAARAVEAHRRSRWRFARRHDVASG